ncbi:hypothetical protein JKP88DRAFT_299012 [Tribonema minus]|uniref:Tyrosine specific protein phosphatases domain-containing protein n=1 Tax=Tribonema minus TaxID=303371 RepID=A0A835ZAS9_9STRA|nr:hypothetical protein JKP88DRAFT_299012 [Tribonema minus]
MPPALLRGKARRCLLLPRAMQSALLRFAGAYWLRYIYYGPLSASKYGLMDKFKAAGITVVLNLTEPGEHPHCGDGLEASSGFPYLPETLMAAGIQFVNFAWEDMTTPPLALLANIVRVLVSHVGLGGKAAVHCHAGYGRTGLVIASSLVYSQNLTADEAVAIVRSILVRVSSALSRPNECMRTCVIGHSAPSRKRPGSVQTPAQQDIVARFAEFVRETRVVYHFSEHATVTLGQYLQQQSFLLGPGDTALRWVPRPIALAARMLQALSAGLGAAAVLRAIAAAPHAAPGRRTSADAGAAAAAAAGAAASGGVAAATLSAVDRRVLALKLAANAQGWAAWRNAAAACERAVAALAAAPGGAAALGGAAASDGDAQAEAQSAGDAPHAPGAGPAAGCATPGAADAAAAASGTDAQQRVSNALRAEAQELVDTVAWLLVGWLEQLRSPALAPCAAAAAASVAAAAATSEERAAAAAAAHVNAQPVGVVRTVAAVVDCLRALRPPRPIGGGARSATWEASFAAACARLSSALQHLQPGSPAAPAAAPGGMDGAASAAGAQAQQLLLALCDGWMPPRVCVPYTSAQMALNVITGPPNAPSGSTDASAAAAAAYNYSRQRCSIVAPAPLSLASMPAHSMTDLTTAAHALHHTNSPPRRPSYRHSNSSAGEMGPFAALSQSAAPSAAAAHVACSGGGGGGGGDALSAEAVGAGDAAAIVALDGAAAAGAHMPALATTQQLQDAEVPGGGNAEQPLRPEEGGEPGVSRSAGSSRRRSLSSGNLQGLVHLPEF